MSFKNLLMVVLMRIAYSRGWIRILLVDDKKGGVDVSSLLDVDKWGGLPAAMNKGAKPSETQDYGVDPTITWVLRVMGSSKGWYYQDIPCAMKNQTWVNDFPCCHEKPNKAFS